MSWIDQGRQEHGYFGSGTAPTPASDTHSAERKELRSRVLPVIAFGSDSLQGRAPQAAGELRQTLPPLRALMPGWVAGSDLPPNDFRRAFLGPNTDPIDSWRVQVAASALGRADTPAGLGHAGEALGEAVESVGGQAWRGAIASASQQMGALASSVAEAQRDIIPVSVPELGNRSAGPSSTHPYPGWLPNSVLVPFSPENERFATETEKLLRSLGNVIADAAAELGQTIFEDRAPGKPTEADGYFPPKNWDGRKVPAPNGRGYGYPDSDGNVWVPSGVDPHGHEPHWNVQGKNQGDFKNRYPGGRTR